ncbi:MAG: type I-E CRISPR-associated protein Cas7/Cse4/CasC [Armatimonadetes bacterium]|nr:type I-E CRISPR-associated protein Cas7/Cse4/CasC [Armatimonadota bacterium]MBX3107834.1 type I-E CRISPR-associated protein Cas7/Cse4/CasC [Fimbriimonadaceae bacterium]
MLIEIHILQNHAPSNLNRDDTGSPKEAVFGGFKRARISSQCIKRSIRRSEVFATILGESLATRTRSLPELVRSKLKALGLSDDLAAIGAKKASGFGTEKGTETKPNDSGHFRTAQTMFLSEQDVDAVAQVIADEALKAKDLPSFEKVASKDLQNEAEDKGFRPVTVDLALFGRMVTSEAFVDVEASSQFAHAISTHKVDHEFDYFTAVDDLEGAGAAMIGDVEFNSACYYKYFNVHVEGLIENLTGEAFKRPATDEDRRNARETAAKAMKALIEAACRVTPSGKQNSFAAHQPPSLVWIEVRDQNLPVSYANAFSAPVDPKKDIGLEGNSATKLKEEAETLAKMYGLEARNRWLLAKRGELDILGTRSAESLKVILDELETVVRSG